MAGHDSLVAAGQGIDYSIYPVITVSGLLIPSFAKFKRHTHGTAVVHLTQFEIITTSQG